MFTQVVGWAHHACAATAGRAGADDPRGDAPRDRETRHNVGLVSVDDGKVRHEWTQMSGDRVVHRENDGKMS